MPTPIPGQLDIENRTLVVVLVFLGLVLGRAGVSAEPAPAPMPSFDPEAIGFFESKVRPILAEGCVRCHGAKKQASELRLDSRAAALQGGANGPAVVPGKPDESLLIQAVRHSEDLKMPPTPQPKLGSESLATLERWVSMGAPWSSDPIPTPEARDQAASRHWAFQPIATVAPPRLDGSPATWASTPIDAFIADRLGREGLTASPRADKRTLIRRVRFDLTGLPPTAEEVAAFVADDRPDAFERLVDRLLASPAYGERWGRHWLDIARYADTRGYTVANQERRYPFAYTYRDYVIEAFNQDLPFDRFVEQQLAADLLEAKPDAGSGSGSGSAPRSLAGLGFLTVGRRFLGNVHDDIDDRIDVVCRGLLGLTVTLPAATTTSSTRSRRPTITRFTVFSPAPRSRRWTSCR